MRNGEKTIDMTTGDPGKLIITFAVPMILGNVVQQLYSMVDSVVVGRFVGKAALASIGATMSVLNMIICVIIGLTMGTCSSMYVVLNMFRGMGMMTVSTIASCMDPVVRLSSAFVLGRVMGRAGLWLGWPAGWAVALVIPLVFYFRQSWQKAM